MPGVGGACWFTDACMSLHEDGDPIRMGQLCENGTQLRPDIVWFGEEIHFFEEARGPVARAARLLVMGTSLSRRFSGALALAIATHEHGQAIAAFGGRGRALVRRQRPERDLAAVFDQGLNVLRHLNQGPLQSLI